MHPSPLLPIDHCDVCGSTALTRAFTLGYVPLPDDMRADADLYPADIMWCDQCRTAHQKYQPPSTKVFTRDYRYRAAMTNDVLNGMRDFVDFTERFIKVAGKKVLDVGCNDGSLLDFFKERGAVTYGITPEDAAKEAQKKGHLVWQQYFTPSAASLLFNGPMDVITFTNVFAHIPKLEQVIQAINALRHEKTIIVIENHYLGAVLAKHQFDTFYHEHPRTYSYTSFCHIADRLGMHVEWAVFPERYGGNIRVVLAPNRKAYGDFPPGYPEYIAREAWFGAGLVKLGKQIAAWQVLKRTELHEYGPINAAAFPARAAILINLLNLTSKDIPAVYEKEGSQKIGLVVPATDIPIKSETEFPMQDAQPSDALLNLAWHIPSEIEARWQSRGWPGRFMQIVLQEDFAC